MRSASPEGAAPSRGVPPGPPATARATSRSDRSKTAADAPHGRMIDLSTVSRICFSSSKIALTSGASGLAGHAKRFTNVIDRPSVQPLSSAAASPVPSASSRHMTRGVARQGAADLVRSDFAIESGRVRQSPRPPSLSSTARSTSATPGFSCSTIMADPMKTDHSISPTAMTHRPALAISRLNIGGYWWQGPV
jgi:hypothetical protein